MYFCINNIACLGLRPVTFATDVFRLETASVFASALDFQQHSVRNHIVRKDIYLFGKLIQNKPGVHFLQVVKQAIDFFLTATNPKRSSLTMTWHSAIGIPRARQIACGLLHGRLAVGCVAPLRGEGQGRWPSPPSVLSSYYARRVGIVPLAAANSGRSSRPSKIRIQ